MEILHTAEMPWGESLVKQRGGNIAHKLLFTGEEGSPDNFMLVLAREAAEFYSPRHAHPWDQLRYCVGGAIPIGEAVYVEGGELAYFPESVPYGPQAGGTNRIVMLLQFGGASGQGFIGPARLDAAREALAAEGRFEGGRYFPGHAGDQSGDDNTADAAGEDAYAAIWRQVTGRELELAEPAYKTPIVMRPAGMRWRETGRDGVSLRTLGSFAERGLILRQWRLGPGAGQAFPAGEHLRFLFVLKGAGVLGGQAVQTGSVCWLSGEPLLEADAAELWVLDISVARIARPGAANN